jgi:acetate kinase
MRDAPICFLQNTGSRSFVVQILLLNAGSSSLKGTLVDATSGAVRARAAADWAGSLTRYSFSGSEDCEPAHAVAWRGHAPAVRQFVRDLMQGQPALLFTPGDLAAVGHRVVHGGEFASSVLVTPEIRTRIETLSELAPLHNPPSLEVLDAAMHELPGVPQVAVFDTAFHATLADEARTYAVPQAWTRDWGIRRFGFHGLSHSYCAGRAAELLLRPVTDLRLVVCHLGHGCSASAVERGRCVETTMGFTPLEGLMMATRSGSLDPGVLLHLQQRRGLTPEQIDWALNRESGLLGVSGRSADMRAVLAEAAAGHEPSRLAIAMYVRRVRQAVGALAVSMGGVDALVFTAGVGEHAAEIRERTCAGLECLGLHLDRQRNSEATPDTDVASDGSPGRILVIATREDVSMLEQVLRVIGGDPCIPASDTC